MATASDKCEVKVSIGENVTGIGSDSDFLKAITNEIINILQLDDDDQITGEIVKDLLENGRQSLIKYEVDIIPKVYDEVMNGNNTEFMSILKKYFRQKWEIQYGSSNSWFIAFLQQYENGENHDIYESVLVRTAHYGKKYLKEHPLLSIVLQLLFENIDDDCLQETNQNVFDDLWMTITNDGLQSITKYSDYIVEKVLDEQVKQGSILYQALRTYYRPNVLSSLQESNITNRQNLYDLALDDVVEHGWISDMKSIQNSIPPRRYQTLLEKLRSFYKKQQSSQKEDVPSLVVPSPKVDLSLPIEHDKAAKAKQEPSIEANQSNTNETQAMVSTENVTSMEEISSDTKSTTEVLDHSIDENTEQKDTLQEGTGEFQSISRDTILDVNGGNEEQLSDTSGQRNPAPEDDELNDSHDLNDGLDDTNKTLICSADTIYISGLPTNIPKQRLLNKLIDVFTTCGDIRIYSATNKPNIYLVPRKENKAQLHGTAIVGFEKEESAMVAIGKYNGKQVPALNNARISVRFHRMKAKGSGTSSGSTLTMEPEPQVYEYTEKEQSTIYTTVLDEKRPKPEPSISSNSSRSTTVRHRITNTDDVSVLSKDRIYVTGLPTNMPEQRLLDTIWDEFITVGSIKMNRATKKPCIHLYTVKGTKEQLSGAATVTFENEASIMKAIEMYNGKSVSSLNNSQLGVQIYRMKSFKAAQPFAPQSQRFVQRPSIAMSRPGQPDGPVSIFWDIENVAIPAGNNAFDILMKLRKRLIEDRKLVEGTFKTYCRNINNIPQKHRTDLYHANVMVQHLESNREQAVDMQIHKDLQQFMEQNKTPSTVVLISGDIDFVKDINELRFRCRHYTIVIHNPQARKQLLQTANEFIPWEEFVEKKCFDRPRRQCTVNPLENPSQHVNQPQLPSIANPNHSFGKTHISTPPVRRPPLMKLNVDKSVVNTDNNVLESNATVGVKPKKERPHHCAKKPDALKNESCSKKNQHKNKKEPGAQLPEPLMSLATDSSNDIAVDSNIVVSSTNTTRKPKNKTNSTDALNAFPCSMCEKKFPTTIARMQHEQDKHKVGPLIDILSMMSTNDGHSHSQPSEHDNQATTDLIAFNDDGAYTLSQPNMSTMTAETSLHEEVSDAESNTSNSSSELNDSGRSETDSPDIEKAD